MGRVVILEADAENAGKVTTTDALEMGTSGDDGG
jgi:hypothetical protein